MDITNIKPCGDKFLVKLDPIEEKTKSGIIVPQTRVMDLVTAVIVSTSGGFWNQEGNWIDIPKEFQPGDRVIFQHGQAGEIDGHPGYAFLQMAAVVAKDLGGDKEVGGGKEGAGIQTEAEAQVQ